TRSYFGASLAALCIALPAMAADDPGGEVEGVIVTGTRAADGVDADKIGSSVTVISAKAMEDRQVRVVSDVLRDVPGFAVSRTGGVGGFTQVRVRGAEGNHVLTLIDGIEAADPFQGEFDFGSLLGDDVAKIEILRGPQSALYGSDAIAGVINYITPTGAEAPGARMRVEFGSMDTLGGSARYAGVAGPLDYVLNAGVQRTGGYRTQTLPGGRRRTGSELESFSAKAAYQVSDALKLRGVVRYTNTHAESNGSSFGRGVVDSPGSYADAKNLYGFAGADLKLADGAWIHSLSIQGADADRDGYSAARRSSGDEGVRVKGSYATTWRIETGGLVHGLTGAADWETET
ncbi:MAG: TonB-dependent receptor plug domain-containing protein, partial [Dehalococcoidia bacterium]|nr:TonB-dependent receptor plug domain-containing protein [Dehalococcoidia bacterium]